mmetsp:Transcript_6318/g.9727  ORF Transcript_6318/g.9727 Transcript_6318/m.9727 type:complete len:597 (+) Transcript_6318:84-1874(+)
MVASKLLLTLVAIYGIAVSAEENLALHGIARQSSTYRAGLFGAAALAIDGNTDGDYDNGSVAHTGGGNAWWEVDLDCKASINRIVVYNRNDCCTDELKGAVVSILTYDFIEVASYAITDDNPEVVTFGLFPAVEGTYVKISQDEGPRGAGILMLAEVEVYGENVGPINNLALKRPAEQSSTMGDGYASKAVDGGIDGNYLLGSVSQTLQQPVNWWRVNLEVIAKIDKIIIFNRIDASRGYINDAMVIVYDYKMREVYVKNLDTFFPDKIILDLDAVEGTFIQILNGNEKSLHLAEVQVFGEVLQVAPVVPPSKNLARAKKAMQVSTMYNGYPELAVDGNPFGFFQYGSVTHTSHLGRPWWTVDLGSLVKVERVVIYNRMDCCLDHLNIVMISILHSAGGKTGGIVAQKPIVSPEPEFLIAEFDDAAGTIVHVTVPPGVVMSLAEVRVYGSVISERLDLALNKPTSQSSTIHGGVSSLAVDGNANGYFFAGHSVTHTKWADSPCWWQVDLIEIVKIDTVVIYNRLDDCCREFINKAMVIFLDTDQNEVASTQLAEDSPQKITLEVHGLEGVRYIKIQMTEDLPLSLAEVQVYGSIVG